jgi:hypothetical protein
VQRRLGVSGEIIERVIADRRAADDQQPRACEHHQGASAHAVVNHLQLLRERFGQRPSDPQAERDDRRAEQEGEPPAPGFERARREQRCQPEPDQPRDQHREIGRGEVQRDVECAPVRRRGLHQIGDVRSDLATERESLQQPECDRRDRRGHPDRRVGWRQREPRHRDAHHREGEDHRRLAPAPVGHSPDGQPAERPRQEPHAERGERKQQRLGRVAREQRPADLGREEAVSDEIVEFERVAGGDSGDLLLRQARSCAFLFRHDFPDQARCSIAGRQKQAQLARAVRQVSADRQIAHGSVRRHLN